METKRLIEASCPDCRGPMSEVRENGRIEFRCLVGHSYSPRTMLGAHSDAEEAALWQAVVTLEESANLVQAVTPGIPSELAQRLSEQAERKKRQAQDIRRILEQLERFDTA